MDKKLNFLKKRIEQTSGLPTLPTVMTTILDLLDNIESKIEDVNDAISQDMVISSKILKLANSAFYGFSRKIETISDAVVLLGFNTVSSLAISVSVFSNLFVKKNGNFNLKEFWKHSIGTAVIAKLIGRTIKFKKVEPLFICGVLHDIGKIILYQKFAGLFNESVLVSTESKKPLYIEERNIIGADHSIIGEWLASKWKFSELIKSVIAYHHTLYTSTLDNRTAQGVYIIALANLLAIENGIGESGDKYPENKKDFLMGKLGITEDYLKVIIEKIPTEIAKAKIFFAVADE